jgi:hypothetical protein
MLTPNAQRTIAILWHNARNQGVDDSKDYVIPLAQLGLPDQGYEALDAAIEELMTTIVTVKQPDGSTKWTQLLGGNDMDDPERPDALLAYSFDKSLTAVLQGFGADATLHEVMSGRGIALLRGRKA